MSKYERCREDVVAHFEFAAAQPEHQPCPACRGTGEGKTKILGMGQKVTEAVCQLCKGTGRHFESGRVLTSYERARESIERHK